MSARSRAYVMRIHAIATLLLLLTSCTSFEPSVGHRRGDGRFVIDHHMICFDLAVEITDSSNATGIRRNPMYDSDTIYTNLGIEGQLTDPCRPGSVTYRYRCGERWSFPVTVPIPAQSIIARGPGPITPKRDGSFDTLINVRCCGEGSAIPYAVAPSGWLGRLSTLAVTPNPYVCPGAGIIRVVGKLRNPKEGASFDVIISGRDGTVTVPVTINGLP